MALAVAWVVPPSAFTPPNSTTLKGRPRVFFGDGFACRLDAGEQDARGFVVRVLGDKFAAESFAEDRGVEFGQQARGGGVIGGHAVEPAKGGLDAVDDFGLFLL